MSVAGTSPSSPTTVPSPSPISADFRACWVCEERRPMKLVPYWRDTAPAFAGAATGPVEGTADAVVVGGGFTGLSAALALAQRGAAVTVLEAGRVVAKQSGRNGGHVNNGLAHEFGS